MDACDGADDAAGALARHHDAALLDLDGVVHVGRRAVPHAVEVLRQLAGLGTPVVYVTNNSLLGPGEMARRLRRLEVPAAERDVVDSAQAAARLAVERCGQRARVMVVGGTALHRALRERELRPVRSARAEPAGVVQGFAPSVSWRQLAEAGYAVALGIPWIVTNTDLTAPTERGTAPGNGALVAAVRAATGATPLVAGKPSAALLTEAARRVGAVRPIVVGDSLDTDIEGAHRAGYDSLLVLTGRTGPAGLLEAPPQRRPTHLGADLRALLAPPRIAERRGDGWACGAWQAWVERNRVELRGHGDPCDGLRAACAAAWSAPGPVDTTAVVAALGEAFSP
ncbi:HAD-IIA family hydrolase [Streptomyces sp. NPDC052309]|uniref:HAD-IIA family hydrolase n=1 Tax=Streptomyces sp. NPDC052309 TaxID=3155421 RepID=UPI00341DF1C8